MGLGLNLLGASGTEVLCVTVVLCPQPGYICLMHFQSSDSEPHSAAEPFSQFDSWTDLFFTTLILGNDWKLTQSHKICKICIISFQIILQKNLLCFLTLLTLKRAENSVLLSSVGQKIFLTGFSRRGKEYWTLNYQVGELESCALSALGGSGALRFHGWRALYKTHTLHRCSMRCRKEGIGELLRLFEVSGFD